MIDFTKLEVNERDLMLTSPFTDYDRLVGRHVKGEKKLSIVEKVDEMKHKYSFSPFEVYLILDVQFTRYSSKDMILLYLGWASYISVPQRKLELRLNEELNADLKEMIEAKRIKQELLIQKNEVDFKRSDEFEVYISDTAYMDRDYNLVVSWKDL